MRSLFALLVLASVMQVTSSNAQSYGTDSGSIEFYSSVPLHSFKGVSNELNGRINLDDGIVDFYVDLETLATGIGKRDKDMRKTLDTDKYPFAEFFGRLLGYSTDAQGDQTVSVEGIFSLHGVEKEITVSGVVNSGENGLTISADWIIRLEDFEIEPPRLLVMKVDQEQRIVLRAVLQPE